MVQVIGLALLAVSGILFTLAAASNPADGRLVPAGGAFLAFGELALNFPG